MELKGLGAIMAVQPHVRLASFIRAQVRVPVALLSIQLPAKQTKMVQMLGLLYPCGKPRLELFLSPGFCLVQPCLLQLVGE